MQINELVLRAHEYAVNQGFWPAGQSLGEKVALIHSEASELLEELRAEHTYNLNRIGEEMADILIRVGDLAGRLGVDLDLAVDVKMAYNETRPYKHSKRF